MCPRVDVDRLAGDARSDLTHAIAARVPALMAELDPQAVLNLDMRCPSCAHDFVVPFSPSAFLVREVVERSKRLIGEVHALAMTYHWSESAILRLPSRRRQAYLDLLRGSPARRDVQLSDFLVHVARLGLPDGGGASPPAGGTARMGRAERALRGRRVGAP